MECDHSPRTHLVRKHLPSVRVKPKEVLEQVREQVVVRSSAGGLEKWFERSAARVDKARDGRTRIIRGTARRVELRNADGVIETGRMRDATFLINPGRMRSGARTQLDPDSKASVETIGILGADPGSGPTEDQSPVKLGKSVMIRDNPLILRPPSLLLLRDVIGMVSQVHSVD